MSLLLIRLAIALTPVTQTPPVKPNLQGVPTMAPLLMPGPQNDPNSKPLSAEEAVKIALRNQLSLKVANANILNAKGQVQISQSKLLPDLSLSAGYSKMAFIGGVAESGTTTGFNSGLAVKQLIFDFERTRNQVREAEARRDSAKWGYTRAEADVVISTKQAFYNYLNAMKVIDVQTANLESRKRQLELAQAKLDKGIGAPLDVVRATTSVGDASLSLVSARQAALNAQVVLAVAMGIDARTPLSATESVEPPLTTNDLGAFVQEALDHRPELLQAGANLKASGYDLESVRQSVFPSLNLALGVNGRGTEIPTNTQNATFQVFLSWDIFDSGNRAGQINQSKANVLTADAQYKLTAQNVVSDVAQAFVALQANQQKADIANGQVKNAEEGVRLAEGRFKAGIAAFIEVTDAQAALVSAQVNAVSANYALQLSRATMLRALGRQSTKL